MLRSLRSIEVELPANHTASNSESIAIAMDRVLSDWTKDPSGEVGR